MDGIILNAKMGLLLKEERMTQIRLEAEFYNKKLEYEKELNELRSHERFSFPALDKNLYRSFLNRISIEKKIERKKRVEELELDLKSMNTFGEFISNDMNRGKELLKLKTDLDRVKKRIDTFEQVIEAIREDWKTINLDIYNYKKLEMHTHYMHEMNYFGEQVIIKSDNELDMLILLAFMRNSRSEFIAPIRVPFLSIPGGHMQNFNMATEIKTSTWSQFENKAKDLLANLSNGIDKLIKDQERGVDEVQDLIPRSMTLAQYIKARKNELEYMTTIINDKMNEFVFEQRKSILMDDLKRLYMLETTNKEKVRKLELYINNIIEVDLSSFMKNTGLSGFDYGKELFDEHVAYSFKNGNKVIHIIIPEHVDIISSSFVQGFFSSIMNKLTMKEIKERIIIQSKNTNIEEMVWDRFY